MTWSNETPRLSATSAKHSLEWLLTFLRRGRRWGNTSSTTNCLAFELIVYELDRWEVSPPDDTLERLRSAAERMCGESALEPDSREAWERVQTRDSF
jgi:hypothetical protein